MRFLAVVALMVCPSASTAFGQGAQSYATRCAVCHQPDGTGSPGLAPPLAGNVGRFAGTEEGRSYLVQVIAYGLRGEIRVGERDYNGYMPPLPQLEDDEVADLLNFVLVEFNGELLSEDFRQFTAAEVSGYRAQRLSPTNLAAKRERMTEYLLADTAPKGDRGQAAESVSSSKSDSSSRAQRDRSGGRAETIRGAELHYISHCRGCHGAQGRGRNGAVPALRDSVGCFVHIPRGRAYLVQVPGVARVPLSDAELAELLNWMLRRFSAGQLPEDFTAYSESEVGRHRAEKLVHVGKARRELMEALESCF